MRTLLYMTLSFIPLLLQAQYKKAKNIPYKPENVVGFNSVRNSLDVYYPSDTTIKKNVFVFIHGGSWKNGKKDTYKFLGKQMARRGFVTVIINYRLSPDVNYESMIEDCSAAIDWTQDHIGPFGGDPKKITIAGHSAGGHLAAMVALMKSRSDTPLYKAILIDAFGLDMFSYFNSYHNDYARSLYDVFSDNPETWKIASPMYHIKPDVSTAFLVLAGSKTYPAILNSSEIFTKQVQAHGGDAEYRVIPGKKHIGMILQLYFKRNPVYDLMNDFICEPDVELKR